jgi:hypothetical protein
MRMHGKVTITSDEGEWIKFCPVCGNDFNKYGTTEDLGGVAYRYNCRCGVVIESPSGLTFGEPKPILTARG